MHLDTSEYDIVVYKRVIVYTRKNSRAMCLASSFHNVMLSIKDQSLNDPFFLRRHLLNGF